MIRRRASCGRPRHHSNRRSYNAAIIDLNWRLAETLSYRGLVVDLGCGDAPYRDLIMKGADRYIGIDWPQSTYGLRGTDVIADISRRLPIASAEVDVVTAFQVLEHVPMPLRTLQEARRILKPGGTLYLTVPWMWEVHEAPHDYWRFSRFGLHLLLEKAGFEQIKIEESTGFWLMIALKLNYHIATRLPVMLQRLLAPCWRLTGWLGTWLDRHISDDGETVSYRATAHVPG